MTDMRPQDIQSRPELSEEQINATKLENYRLSLIHGRWLSTIILVVHLEIEAVLVELLRGKLAKPEKVIDNKSVNLSFSHKLVLCEGLDLIDQELLESIRALNKLRNQLHMS